MAPSLLVGKSDAVNAVHLNPRMANRHGLIAGATGTGKTVTLQALAQGFSRIGVPVFLADVKGDLSGIGAVGGGHRKVEQRVSELAIEGFEYGACPVTFWDLLGEQGHPVRTTITDMGPLLLARLLGLNDTQEGVLNIVFAVCDDNGWLLLDLKDLKATLAHISDEREALRTEYGNISPASVGAIQRKLLQLENQGVERLFGEPALMLDDLIQTDEHGQGIINLLVADKLIHTPALYSTFLLWLLSELFEQLPEAGDPEKPKFVMFFDEAHLLFDDAPKVLVDKVEQVVRLIRSKGVGVYFVTQSPLDIPDDVLGQLGNRVQHALRAFTPNDQKAVKAAAQTFRANPDLDTEAAIKEVGVGEALVSMLEDSGAPGIVQRVFIAPPGSRIGPLNPEERQGLMARSIVGDAYDKAVDRESAYEVLKGRSEEAAKKAEADAKAAEEAAQKAKDIKAMEAASKARTRSSGGQRQGVVEALAKSAARSIGSTIGRQIVRGILGSLFGGRR
ncbi:MAG: DUF853 family protein [Gammaproteobacteria bacterium]|nr:DUF853 family protein [Gammaproteobacteria bacterium]MCP5136524.1 DUF853 family protein [Gammaproteobacteria bacterium]